MSTDNLTPAPQPVPAPKQKKKKWPLVVGGIALLVIVGSCGANAGKNDTTPAASTSVEQGTPAEAPEPAAPAKPAKELVVVDAATILADFKANEAAADQKYAGKALQVAGTVDKVDTEFLNKDKYVIRVSDGSPYSFVNVNCNGIDAALAATMVVGNPITIEGDFKDGGDLGIEVVNCKVL